MTRIYIGGKFTSAHRLRHERDRIHGLGLGQVLSTWFEHEDVTEDIQTPLRLAARIALTEAVRDVEQIKASDLVIIDTEGQTRRGGRETEFGLALGLDKQVWTVGRPWRHGDNIFFQLVPHFETWDNVLYALTKEVRA